MVQGLLMFLQRLLWQQREASLHMASDFKTGYNTNASDNDHIFTTKSPKGNIGKVYEHFLPGSATDEDMNNLKISLYKTSEFQADRVQG